MKSNGSRASHQLDDGPQFIANSDVWHDAGPHLAILPAIRRQQAAWPGAGYPTATASVRSPRVP